MLLVKERRMKEFPKEAPHIGIPYSEVESKNQKPFYQYDAETNQIIAGYQKGPKKSYTKELAKKYRLIGK